MTHCTEIATNVTHAITRPLPGLPLRGRGCQLTVAGAVRGAVDGHLKYDIAGSVVVAAGVGLAV